ncbi:MAG TPA: pyridoxamine 5'-phosphate oxidase family protein [Candidatus Binatia bacterium]|nr:pyridoxamine 5'-phosphate oxidase family protein [Candidatus Binatia bacterium]
MSRKRRSRLQGWARKFLETARVVRLATVSRDGRPHVVPVCHAVEGDQVYIGTDRSGQKVRNIRATGRAALVADHYVDSWKGLRGVSVSGRADLFTRGPVFERGVRALYRKYPHYPRVAALEPGDSAIIRVKVERVMSWKY